MISSAQILDCLLYFKGSFLRKELCNILSISPASATREIKKYRELHETNINYDVSNKRYVASKEFTPQYTHDTNFALNLIFENKLIIETSRVNFSATNELPVQLPNQDIAAQISRACFLKQCVSTTYLAANSKNAFRTISPQQIFCIGNLWYARAFSKESGKNGEFRTFKLVRFLNSKLSSDAFVVQLDSEWETNIYLTLAPHTKHQQQESLRLDLGLNDEPVINIKTNEVLAGYLLHDLHVDCSLHASLDPLTYQYQLMNRHELEDIGSMILAPGFEG
ncbi:WYL domain-containing protein [Pseudoalteromonas sp. MMG012]|uniref:WYL domain-containing protein n=1 Tax=Pseudoalteromonas sp. MMG012 TaxID=2822686 RepID=UPI001B3A2FE8|nr:WYL domain-containing protein [Pseudoalteromonas sp. MMG012]MBQ4848531.1 WYL domain-containing protein [Pseudoalteromonas sp. MMG012]